MFCSEKLKSEIIEYFLLTISIYGSAKKFDEKKKTQTGQQFACPELYCDWFSTKLTFWNQIQMLMVF